MSASTESGPREHLPGPASSPPGWTELAEGSGALILTRIDELAASGASSERINRRLRDEGADPGLIAAALTVARLRSVARTKFGEHASQMLFTQAGLEQASRRHVAELHAARFAGCSAVADLGCGLGAESLAFLRAGLGVRAVEIDPLTAAFARHNLGVEAEHLLGEQGSAPAPNYEVFTGDAVEMRATVLRGDGAIGAFLDPARRTAGHRDTRRLTSSDDYSPSLDFAYETARSAHAGGIKLGPGFDRDLIPADAEAQWVSVDGQLVEMGLWFGSAARPNVRRVATVIRESAGGVTSHELLASEDSSDAEVRELGEYLIEPDGSVIRARLIGLLAAQLDAGMIHDGIAYLTADRAPETPFAQSFRILEELPAREKDLARALKARGIGRLEIKKRGVDVDPAALRTRLRLKGDSAATLILSRSAGKHVALLAERC